MVDINKDSAKGKAKTASESISNERIKNAIVNMDWKELLYISKVFILDMSVTVAMVLVVLVIVIVIIIILDAHDLLKVTLKDSTGKDTGKRIHDAAYESMDPAVIEKQVGMKVVNLADFEKMNKDLNEMKTKLQQTENDLKSKDSKIADISKERDAYKSSAGVGQFCGNCIWDSDITCEARKVFLIDKTAQSEADVVIWMIKEYSQCLSKSRSRHRNLRSLKEDLN